MIQEVLTYLIIAGAFTYSGYGFVKLFIRKKSGCSCGSCGSSCGFKAELKQRNVISGNYTKLNQ